MPKTTRLWSNFSKGELSPRIEGRPDLAAYFEGGRTIENFVLLRRGGAERRPGTRLMAEVKDSTRDTILLPFEFSVDDAFHIEVGHLYMRFYKNNQRIEVAGVPVEIVSPYQEADLRVIHFTQSADVLFLFHPTYAQRKLSRVSDTQWVLSTIQYIPPPSFEADIKPSFTLAYKATTGTDIEFAIPSSSTLFLAADVGRQIIAGAGRATIKSIGGVYWVLADIFDAFDAAPITVGPGTLTSVGATVTTSQPHGCLAGDLLRVTSGAQAGEWRVAVTIVDANTVTLDWGYPVDQTGVDWARHVPILPGEWALRGTPQTTLDPDKREPVGAQVTLVAGAAAFRTTDVGKFIFIYGGLIKITQFVSSTQIKGEIMSILADTSAADPAAAPAGAWTLEDASWSTAQGFPRTGEFFQGRLGQAGTTAQPTSWWLSASDDFEGYAVGANADDAIEYTIASRQVNRVVWLADIGDLFAGTSGAELRIVGERNGEPLGGDKIPLVERVSTHGCAPVQPAIMDRQILFLDRSTLKIFALAYSLEQDAFDPIELTAPADHITGTGIRLGPLGVRHRLDPQVLFVRGDGVLVVLTFFPHEKVIGFSRVTTDGAFEAVSVIPRPTGQTDQVAVIVRRTINGQTKRFVEYFDENASALSGRAWSSLQTDCAVIYNGAATTTITGLSHLEGKTVDVVADGSFKGTKVVTGGAITLDDAASVVEVGLHYDAVIVTMRPAIPETIIEGRPRSWDDLSVRLFNTMGGQINGEWLQYVPSDLDELGLFVGDRKIVGQGWDTDGRITIEQTQPYPMTVLAVYGSLSVGDHV